MTRMSPEERAPHVAGLRKNATTMHERALRDEIEALTDELGETRIARATAEAQLDDVRAARNSDLDFWRNDTRMKAADNAALRAQLDDARREIERLRVETAATDSVWRCRADAAEAEVERLTRELAEWRGGNPSDDLWRVRAEQAEKERDALRVFHASLPTRVPDVLPAAPVTDARTEHVWRCSSCGEGLFPGDVPSSSWRWAGAAWAHQCGDPQAGHFIARDFGLPSVTTSVTDAAPTCTCFPEAAQDDGWRRECPVHGGAAPVDTPRGEG